MGMLESMVEYLADCPVLPPEHHLEYTEDGENWALYDGADAAEETYWDGSQLRKRRFTLCLRLYAGDDGERGRNNRIMQGILDWVGEQSRTGNLPLLPPGKQAESLTAEAASMNRMDRDGMTAAYQLSLCLRYQEGEK